MKWGGKGDSQVSGLHNWCIMVAFTDRKDGGGAHFRGSGRMMNSVSAMLGVRSCKHPEFISGQGILYLGMHLWRKTQVTEANVKVVCIWMVPEAR